MKQGANCIIKRSSNKEIQEVLKQNGKPSELYVDVASHSATGNLEDALSIFKNIYSKKLSKVSEDDMTLSHKVGDNTIDTFKGALEVAIENQPIEIGIIADGIFTKLAEIKKTTDISTETGFIQRGILNDSIEETRVKSANEYKHAFFGKSDLRKEVSKSIVIKDALENLGDIKVDGTAFTVKRTIGIKNLFDKSGKSIEISNAELDAMNIEEVRKNFENSSDIIAERLYKQLIPLKRNLEQNSNQEPLKTEDDIKLSYLSLLKKMGITVTSISNYLEKYEVKNGVAIGAEALADIGNQIVAIVEGFDTVDNLREETVHFLLEAMPHSRLEDILRNIHKTEEYKQFAETYRAVYAQENETVEEVEDLVRKEVLAKVVLNALKNEPKTEIEKSFFDNVISLIQEFFTRISGLYKPSYLTEIENLTTDINNRLNTGDISGLELDNFQNSKKRYYSLTENEKLLGGVKKIIEIKQKEVNKLRNSDYNSPVTRNLLMRLEKELDNNLDIQAVRGLIQNIEYSANVIKEALKDSKDKGKSYDLTTEELIVFNNLEPLRSVIKEMSITIQNDIDNKVKAKSEWRDVVDTINRVSTDISTLQAQRRLNSTNNFIAQVEEMTVDRGMSARDKEALLAWSRRAETENTIIHATFGTLVNSNDFLANMFSTVVANLLTDANMADHQQIKRFQQKLRDLGGNERVVSDYVTDGYFMSEVDMPKYNKAIDTIFIQEYKKVFKDTKLTDKEIITLNKKGELFKEEDADNQDIVVEAFKKEKVKEDNRRMSDNYYAEFEANLEKSGVSKQTNLFLRAISEERKLITNRAVNENGQIDIQTLSLQDRQHLKQLDLQRKQAKSYVNEIGEFKTGLEMVDGVIVPSSRVALSAEAKIALELNNLDGTFAKTAGKDMPQSFIDLINSKQGLSWDEQRYSLESNASISLSSEFWEQFVSGGDNKSSMDKAIEDVSDMNIKLQLIVAKEEIQNYKFKLTSLLKTFSGKNNPYEIDVEIMPQITKDVIKDLQQKIDNIYAENREILAPYKTDALETEGVSSTNQAWKNILSDLSLKNANPTALHTVNDIVKIAKENMTDDNSERTTKIFFLVRDFNRGTTTRLPKYVKNTLTKMGMSSADLKTDSGVIDFMNKYIESKLLPYYKNFTPEGYINFQKDLDDSKNIVETLKNIKDYKYVEVTPNYSFFEEDVTNRNTRYIENSGFGATQPDLVKYRNEKFYAKFGKVTRNADGTYDTSEKNQKEFELYKAIIEFRKAQLKTMEADASYNVYQAPPIRRLLTERIAEAGKTLSLSGIKENIENLTKFTEDDLEIGDNRFGNDGKIIPKKYLQPLDNIEDISTDIFTTLAMVNKEANLYASRKKHYGNAMSIMEKLEERAYDREATATNRYRMISSAMDNDFYGIKQSETASFQFLGKKVDGAKIINNLGIFSRFKGLGGSAIIPLTARLTGGTKILVERIVGQYINKEAYKLGSQSMSEKIGAARGEIGAIQTTSWLNSVGQYFGAFEKESSLNGSKFDSITRNAPKTAMILYQAANFPLYAKGLLCTLYDFKIVDGVVMKSSDFKRMQRLGDYKITAEKIQTLWENEKSNIHDLIKVDENSGEILIDDKNLIGVLKNADGSFMNDEEIEREKGRFLKDIRIQVKNLNVRIDMQLSHEDKVIASRHYILNFLMQFKGFMIPLWEERFKGQKMNTQSRQWESGSYSGIFKMANDITKEWSQNGHNILKAFKDEYYGNISEYTAELDLLNAKTNKTVTELGRIQELKELIVERLEISELRRQNLKRLGVDMLVVNSIILLGMLLRGMADDPDKEDLWALQMANLVAYRVATEVHQSNFGIIPNYISVVKAPLQAFDQVIDMRKILDEKAFDEGKVASSLGRVLPFAGSISQITDPRKAFLNKVYYQEVNSSMFTTMPAYFLMNEDK